MTDSADWIGRVGKSWASEWQRTDRSFAHLTERLLAVAQATGFAHALDIGCGAGELTLRLAADNPQARATGVDISEDLIAISRERGAALRNASFELADAAGWTAPVGLPPDLLVSRHGVMFFDDPVAAFTHIAGQAAPGARLAFSCFRAVGENGWVRELVAALPPGAATASDPDAPGPFAFARRERVEAILAAAGWGEPAFEPLDYPMVGGQGEGAVDDAVSYFLRIGPAARAVSLLDGEEKAQTIARLRTAIARHLDNGVVALPAAAWIVTARKPG